MEYRILAIGDVVGESGLAWLANALPVLKREKGVHFAVVNGENVSGSGITPRQARTIHDAGGDAITLGNHTFGKKRILEFLDETPWILRPANFSPLSPGHGCEYFDYAGIRIRVINLVGRCLLDWKAADPFTAADQLLSEGDAAITLVDFHAEATSEKLALAYYLDGRVSALWGTHTHVPTADEQIFPQGMGYLSDLGMTGPIHSVIGIRPQQSIESYLGGLPGRYQTADGPCKMQGALFTIDGETGLCSAVERIDVREEETAGREETGDSVL